MSELPLILGWDVGGTKSAIVVGSADGQRTARVEWPSEVQQGPEAMIADFLSAAGKMQAAHPNIKSVGVSIGGPLDGNHGIIHNPPNLPGWNAIPLKARLQAELNLPVNVLHDAAACALAEYRWGCDGKKPARLAYLTCGTGLGVGFVFDGRPYMGAGGRYPEIGHIRLRAEGPTAFGKAGSAEACCSGTGLSLLAGWLFPERWAKQPIDGRRVAELAGESDPDALEVIRTSARATGQLCAWIADTLLLDRIILGSLARYLGDLWLSQARETFRQEVLPFVADNCPVEQSRLDHLQDLSALAAGCLER